MEDAVDLAEYAGQVNLVRLRERGHEQGVDAGESLHGVGGLLVRMEPVWVRGRGSIAGAGAMGWL